jgi:hypothetical protein
MARLLTARVCVNAHFAVNAVVLASTLELFWMVTHWGDSKPRW